MKKNEESSNFPEGKTPPQNQARALLELTWLTLFKVMEATTNYTIKAWNSHPYFKNLVCVPEIEIDSARIQIYVSSITRSSGEGGKPFQVTEIEKSIKECMKEDALKTYSFLPVSLIEFCADEALERVNTGELAEVLHLFTKAHKDILAPLMIAMVKRWSLDEMWVKEGTPMNASKINEEFIWEVLKMVGVKLTLPVIFDHEKAINYYLLKSLADSNIPPEEARVGEIMFFTRQALASIAHNKIS